VSLVVPPLCVACREPELGGGALCSDCVDGLVPLAPAQAAHRSPALARAWAPYSYEGVARRVVMALKARSATQAARFMAAAIEARAPGGLLDTGVLVPVPGQPDGNSRRGFDHAQAIAAALGEITGLEVVGALRRSPVRAQVGLARGERQANASGSVSVRPGVPPGGRAILVDDVCTTGATLDACALALRGAGAGEAVAVCFARTMRRQFTHGQRPPGHVACSDAASAPDPGRST
jgi:predicted amidophosphoribosyltransferase